MGSCLGFMSGFLCRVVYTGAYVNADVIFFSTYSSHLNERTRHICSIRNELVGRRRLLPRGPWNRNEILRHIRQNLHFFFLDGLSDVDAAEQFVRRWNQHARNMYIYLFVQWLCQVAGSPEIHLATVLIYKPLRVFFFSKSNSKSKSKFTVTERYLWCKWEQIWIYWDSWYRFYYKYGFTDYDFKTKYLIV